MAYGGNDWLALTPEPTLEPDLPICDPHHHFWDKRADRVPYQRYLLPDLLADIGSGHNVRSTVFIEARSMYRAGGPEELRAVGEVEFVQGIAAASASGIYGPARVAAAIIGNADLGLGDRVKPVLEALQAASPNRFRGVRRSASWDAHPDLERRAPKGLLADEKFRAGARVLARMGMSMENTLYFPQLPELADFARAIPDLPIVLNHIGGLYRVGSYGNRDDEVIPAWRKGIATVAQCPNIYLKLGGVGQVRYGFDWYTWEKPIGSEKLAEALAPLMYYCIEQFGPDRCMFESNFPPDKVSSSYNVLFNAFKRLSKGYGPAERAALFHDTAAKVYRIKY
ncbi:MAG: amidohydrolase [SAR202 cluster bacterium]|nr:amidohydrolase [SAR202 cluster bacterium]